MQNKFARTDLAAEAVGRLDRAPEGVFADTLSLHGCEVSRVVISSEAGAEALGKPMGKYLTLEMADYVTRRGQSFPDCAAALRDLLKSFEAVERAQSFLIACLGNRAVTPDAVGPLTADGIIVTRHLKSSLPQDFAAFSSVSVVRPGVLGTTGIESAQTIRSMLSEAYLGCPVIAVGVPTVADAAALSDSADAQSLFVTPRNIDELVRSASKLIAYGIDLALHRGLGIEDIDALIE